MKDSLSLAGRFFLLFLVIAAFQISLPMSFAAGAEAVAAFEIRAYELSGNSIFPAEKLQKAVKAFTGAGKTAADVEKARDALEKLYHDAGYPAVLVNIPEQTIKNGIVKLQVIESRIGRVKISGNRYFTSDKMMRDMQSFNPGQILYLPDVQQEIGRLNRSQDFKVEPVMTPGSEPGTIDVDLKVDDHFPLHGSLELNDKNSYGTDPLRLVGMIRYDNLWQMEHSISFQYQTSPQDSSEVEVFSASYILPAPWEKDHQWVLYGIRSDSSTYTDVGDGFRVVGKGTILGTRYVIPLPPYNLYAHNITIGLDYKDYNTSVNFNAVTGSSTLSYVTPVTYMPLSFVYNSVLQDGGGMTQFNAGLNISFRGVVSEQSQFENARYKGDANYIFVTAGIQRNQKLPWGMGLLIKVDGQAADNPLIPNEEYIAGGMENVRGYMESEAQGDDAIHGTIELSFPDPLAQFGIVKQLQTSPYIFFDIAQLNVKDPLPAQNGSITLDGAGAGIRGSLTKYLEYEFDWAVALNTTNQTQANTNMFYFKLKSLF
ncbi:MAG: ShlB/FhaC/HecB family hemolysin secretion/activation protein [Smithella sp.]